YSSLMFDYVNTGRPILFFTYDLEHYRDTLRGFYFDFANSAPGPLVYTSEILISAIRHIDRIQSAYSERYRWFQNEFCDLDDGYAAARLADRMLVAGGDLAPGDARAPRVGTVDTRRSARPMTPIAGDGQWHGRPPAMTGAYQQEAVHPAQRRALEPGGPQRQVAPPGYGQQPARSVPLGSVPRQPVVHQGPRPVAPPDGRTYEGVIV
ncbi:CDP-glycerol glycerophosphotransferase family protein, partial [Streptomyces tendae]